MEDENEGRLDRVKRHLQENKKTYLIGAGCLVAGCLLRPKVINIVDVCTLKYKSPVTNIVTTELARRGHPGYLIKCLETGEIFASKHRVAESLGINRASLNEFLRGLRPDVNGYTFEIIGEAK